MAPSMKGPAIKAGKCGTEQWNTFVCTVVGNNSKAVHRARADLIKAASGILTPRRKGRFCVIDRATLQRKGGKDPKTMAASLRAAIKSDMAAGIAERKKARSNAVPAPTLKRKKQVVVAVPESDDDDDDESFDGNDTKLAEVPPIEGLASATRPNEDELAAAEAALAIDEREGAPDRIYVLADFPKTPEEAEALLSPTLDGVLDAVIELQGDDDTVFIPTMSVSRSSSNASFRDSVGGDAEAGSDAGDPLDLYNDPADGVTPTMSRSSSRASFRSAQAPPLIRGGNIAVGNVFGKLQRAAAVTAGPGWGDVAFLRVPVCPIEIPEATNRYNAAALVKEFMRITGDVALEKYRFRQYLLKGERVVVPEGCFAEYAGSGVHDLYRSLMHGVLEESSSVAVILGAMALAVANEYGGVGTSSLTESAQDALGDASPTTAQRLIPVQFGDDALLRAARTYSSKGDSVLHPCLRNESVVDIERRYAALLPFPGSHGRHLMPQLPELSLKDRGMEINELRTFTDIPHALTAHARRVEHFEQLMRRVDSTGGPNWRFSNRVWGEQIPAHVLPQVMLAELVDEPELHTHYDPLTDELLLAVHKRTPPGRQRTVTDSAFAHANLRPGFNSWPNVDPCSEAVVYEIDPAPLHAVKQESRCLYPADHGTIRVEKLSSGEAWCTVRKDGHCFGLRAATINNNESSGGLNSEANFASVFFAGFDDGSRTEVRKGPPAFGKPDGFGTVVMSNTTISGLVVEHCSNGTIEQAYISCSIGAPKAALEEISRKIIGKGTVIRALRSGGVEILFACGDRAVRAPNGWNITSFSNGGQCTYRHNGDCARVEVLDPPQVENRLDPETEETVLSRSDGVKLIKDNSGNTLACFADGTKISTIPCSGPDGGTLITVCAAGFATVNIQADVDATACKHSMGGRVDISRGGRHTRSSTRIPDGTVVDIDYDTRVTANINGLVRTLKYDGSVVAASDDGKVEYKPGAIATAQFAVQEREEARSTPRDAREEPDTAIGCYVFECDTARLEMSDHENNIFRVYDAVTHASQAVNVDLAGEFEAVKAIVNAPLEPRLFVLMGDGNATELLREEDVAEFQRRASLSSHVERTVPETALYSTDSPACLESGKCRTFLLTAGISNTIEVDNTKQQLPPTVRETFPRGLGKNLRLNAVWTIFRNFFTLPILSAEDQKAIKEAEQRYRRWKHDQAMTENRFAVDDERDASEIEAERLIQRRIMKERRRIRKAELKKERAARKLLDSESRRSSYAESSTSSTTALGIEGATVVSSTTAIMPMNALMENTSSSHFSPTERSETATSKIHTVVEEAFSEREDNGRTSPFAQPNAIVATRPPCPPYRYAVLSSDAPTAQFWSSDAGIDMATKLQRKALNKESLECTSVKRNTGAGTTCSNPAAPIVVRSRSSSPGVIAEPYKSSCAPTLQQNSHALPVGSGRNAVAAVRSSKEHAMSASNPTHQIMQRGLQGIANERFAQIEGETVRRLNTSSTAGRVSESVLVNVSVHAHYIFYPPRVVCSGDVNHKHTACDFAQVFPKSLDFGRICEGQFFSMDFQVHNLSNTIMRYRSVVNTADLPKGTELQLGDARRPLASGISTKVSVKLCGVAPGPLKTAVQIITPAMLFSLPVTATIVSSEDFDAETLSRSVIPLV